MPDYYIGDIASVGFDYATPDFLPCDGQLLPIQQYDALYALIGTIYGGDGQTNFALPNLNGRAALGAGAGPGLTPYTQGNHGGSDSVTLSAANLPAHTHSVHAAPGGGKDMTDTPVGKVPAGSGDLKVYATAPDSTTTMNSAMIKSSGGGQAHENRQPFLCLYFVICVAGLWPPRD
jgi:microcystin-dependent protein